MMIAAPTYRFTRSRSGNESGEKVGGAPGATVAVAAGARPGWCGKQPRTESVIAITTTTKRTHTEGRTGRSSDHRKGAERKGCSGLRLYRGA
jgi:hypothetical protein